MFDGISGVAQNVYIVTGTPGSGATLVEDGNSATKGDTLYVTEGSDAGKQLGFNGTAWVVQNIAGLTEPGFLQAFTGKSGNGSEMPDYSSTNFVTDGESLEAAIGALDSALHTLAHRAKSSNVTTTTLVDNVLVDGVVAVEWTIHCRAVADPTKIYQTKLVAIHNGSAAADALAIDLI